jgi:NhaP-type Na+/H+ or K+/H+ antiporter
MLLVMVALGMGSILNTFAHYHTPLSISFFRVLNGIWIGVALGLLGAWFLGRLRQWWLR